MRFITAMPLFSLIHAVICCFIYAIAISFLPFLTYSTFTPVFYNPSTIGLAFFFFLILHPPILTVHAWCFFPPLTSPRPTWTLHAMVLNLFPPPVSIDILLECKKKKVVP